MMGDYSSDEESVGTPLRNINVHTKDDELHDLSILQRPWHNLSCLHIGSEDAIQGMWERPVLPHQDDWETTGECLGRSEVKALTFGELDGVTKENIEALCKGGLDRNESIEQLYIDCGDFLGGRGFTSMSSFFERTSSLGKISIRSFAASGCDEFASGLALAVSKFNSLRSFESQLNQAMSHKLLEALAGHPMLESLHLRSDANLDNKACSALLALLRKQKSKLSDLTLELCYDDCNYMFGNSRFSWSLGMLEDHGLAALASGLCGRNTLKTLKIVGNQEVSSRGWGALSTLLQSSRSMLETLSMPLNSIGDDGMTLLANSLARNKVLRYIDLTSTRDVTSRGWRAFCIVFQSEDSALETMKLWDNNITEDVHSAWASSLASNRNMKELNMSYCPRMSPVGMAEFTRILCDKSTIMSTFLSNHTFEKVVTGGHNTANTPELDLLLEINKDHTSFGAARQKIIMHHFSDAFGSNHLELFKEMDLGILPGALAWMGRVMDPGASGGMKFKTGSSLLYRFLREMPALFENTCESRKRKRN